MLMISSIQYNYITQNEKIYDIRIKLLYYRNPKKLIEEGSLRTDMVIIFNLLNELVCKQHYLLY